METELRVSPVGLRNGSGCGVVFFRALNFLFLEPESVESLSLLSLSLYLPGILGDAPEQFKLRYV